MSLPDPRLTGRDPWAALARYTDARIALGRAGGSVRSQTLLDFRLSHARARDAVLRSFDLPALARALEAVGIATHALATAVSDRHTYLLRPDLGRRLDAPSAARLDELAVGSGPVDLVVVVSDGLAAAAAERHAVATLLPLLRELRQASWRVAPVFLVPLARVKLQDEIGARLGARFSLMLLGERPGLGSPDSLGAYFTAAPAAERTDADRNCVSNIRPEGIAPAQAAAKLVWLLRESASTGRSGIDLKDAQPATGLKLAP